MSEQGAAPSAVRPASEEDIKRHCLERGPAYAHPRRVIATEALPLNSAGKVHRAVLRDRMKDILMEAPRS